MDAKTLAYERLKKELLEGKKFSGSNTEFRSRIDSAIEELSERESDIIKSYYGFDGTAKSLTYIADELNITYEAARKIRYNALKKLCSPYVGIVINQDFPKNIVDLGLSVRTYHVLLNAGICNVSEFMKLSESALSKLHGMGEHSLDECLTVQIRYQDISSPYDMLRITLFPKENFDEAIFRFATEDAFTHISELELRIIKMRCGFDDGYYKSLKTISQKMKLSFSEVRRLYNRTVSKLQRMINYSPIKQKEDSDNITSLITNKRVSNALKRAGITKISEFMQLSEEKLIEIRFIGVRGLTECLAKQDEFLSSK